MEFEHDPAWRVVVLGLSGELCRVDLEHADATTVALKERISVALSVPAIEFDLFAPDATTRMKPRDELSLHMPPGSGEATVSFLMVSIRTCSSCGAPSGFFDRKPKLRECPLCLDVFYCNRGCACAHFEKHSPTCQKGNFAVYQTRGRIHDHDLLR